MSFQLYLQVFSAGKRAGFSLDALRNAFAGMVIELEDDYWQADFGPAGRSDLFLSFLEDGSERIHSVSLDHPSTDERLWQAVWTLLGLSGTVFHFPDLAAPLARDPDVSSAMPPDVLSTLGTPTTLGSVQELQRAVVERLTESEAD